MFVIRYSCCKISHYFGILLTNAQLFLIFYYFLSITRIIATIYEELKKKQWQPDLAAIIIIFLLYDNVR